MILVPRRGVQLSNIYRLDYWKPRQLFTQADTPLPDWFPSEIPEPTALQDDLFTNAAFEEVVEAAFPHSDVERPNQVSGQIGQSLDTEHVRVSGHIGQSGVDTYGQVSGQIGHSLLTEKTTEKTNRESLASGSPNLSELRSVSFLEDLISGHDSRWGEQPDSAWNTVARLILDWEDGRLDTIHAEHADYILRSIRDDVDAPIGVIVSELRRRMETDDMSLPSFRERKAIERGRSSNHYEPRMAVRW